MDLFYRGILQKDHSWGVVGTELTLALERQGFNIGLTDPVKRTAYDANYFDPRVQHKLKNIASPTLSLSYCVPRNLAALPKHAPIAHIYNYEYSVIPSGWANLINKHAQLFLPSSNFAKEIFIKNGVRSDIAEVLPHGIDLTRYNPQIKPVDFKSKKFTFLCVSSPHHRKGFDILLQAFGEEFATVEEVELLIKTSIPKKKAPYELDIRKVLDEARKKVALPQVRIITDYYPSLGPLYRAAHCYVSATHSECFGLTELEAACCGIPVIAPKYGGYLDFLNDQNAYLVKNTLMYATRPMQYWHYSPRSTCCNPDKEHLKQQMRAVFSNYKAAQQKARVAYEQVAPKYTWDKVAEQFIQLTEKHKLIPKGQLSKRAVPVGEITPEPQVDNTANTDKEKVDALRKSLKKKMKEKNLPAALPAATDSTKLTISSHTIIYNEEHNIVSFLHNIHKAFDEIILVDGGSSDNTVRLINDYIRQTGTRKIKLFVRPQRDKTRYSPRWNQTDQRNHAVKQCTSDWLMMLDADERLDRTFKEKMRSLCGSGRSKAYAFPKYHYWEAYDKIRTDRFWYPNYNYRLWKNGENIRYENKARHCQPVVKHLKLPPVLGVQEVSDFGHYSDLPIHHLHYLLHSPNELGLYRANERDVKTLGELNKGLKTREVTDLRSLLPNDEIAQNLRDVRRADDQEGLIPNTINIAFIMENFNFYSGGRYYLYQHAYSLAQAGANVWLLTNMVPLYTADFPKIENFRISPQFTPPGKVKFDVVIGTPSNCGRRALRLAKEHNAKLLMSSLETPNYVKEYRGGKDSTEDYWKEYKKYLPLAENIFTLAQLPSKYLCDWINYPMDKVRVTPPAINDYALKKVGKVKKANTLVFISRLVEHKRLDRLLTAIAQIQKQLPNPPTLDIIGNGNPKKIRELLHRTKVRGRYYANISDTAKFQLIKRSHGLITCSDYEGFGISPIEGLACNVPVVCSDLPIFRETLQDYVTYYPNDQINVLANHLLALLKAPHKFTKQTAEGQKHVLANYSFSAMVGRSKELVTKLATDIKGIPEKKQPEKIKQAIEKAQPKKQSNPKFSVCIIALNEEEYIEYNLQQMYHWDCCHEIIIVEGSVEGYPKDNLRKGLSGDKTTELIRDFPDPDNKIKYVSGTFKDKIEQRNEYAKRVTGDYVLVLDADEFYSYDSLEALKKNVLDHPDVDLFTFDFSKDESKRTYYHLWYNFNQHVIGGYWDVPHNRIYKWVKGTCYQGGDHNHPVRPDGTKLIYKNVKWRKTDAICVHTGFAKLLKNQKDKNQFYRNRGEGKEKDPILRRRRQMYIDCRTAYENWTPKTTLPHNAQVLKFTKPLPEALLNHPYVQDAEYLLRERS